jgi:hypothetical protein
LRGRHSFGSETTPTLDLDKTPVELVLDRIRVRVYPEKMEDRHNLGEIHVRHLQRAVVLFSVSQRSLQNLKWKMEELHFCGGTHSLSREATRIPDRH